MPCGYQGRLLAVAISGDSSRIAAAGEAVQAEQLRPLSTRRPAAAGAAGQADVAGGGVAAAAAAAAVAGAVGRRRRGQKGAAVALDALAQGDAFEQLSTQDAQQVAPQAGCAQEQQGTMRAPVYVFELVM